MLLLECQVLPIEEINKQQKGRLVTDLNERFGYFKVGPYPEKPKLALLSPVYLSGNLNPKFYLICGISARREPNEKYLLFFDLRKTFVTNILTKAKTYEDVSTRKKFTQLLHNPVSDLQIYINPLFGLQILFLRLQ